MDINNLISVGNSSLTKVVEHFNNEIKKIRTGKASPAILESIKVEYYGNPTVLSQAANISTPDSRTISIQPWDKSLLSVIEQAIFASNLGITPMNDGETIRLSIPPLTEERRKDLVKQVFAESESAKISLRSERQKMMEFIKAEMKDGYPEDEGKKKEKEVQNLVNSYGKKIEELANAKEKDIMKV